MAQQIINLGATGSGAGGDSARTAFEKAIANFAELYIAALPGTAAQKQAAREMFGLGTAATKAAQTGPTDTTYGALMTVGAFGIGQHMDLRGTVFENGTPADVFGKGMVSGFARGGPDGLKIPVITSNSVSGVLSVYGHWDDGTVGAGSAWREFRASGGRVYHQDQSYGAWGAWREVFNTGNQLSLGTTPATAQTALELVKGTSPGNVLVAGAELVGRHTVECLAFLDAGSVPGATIYTNIPAAAGIMPNLIIRGALNSYTEPFEARLSWYFYADGIYLPNVLITATGGVSGVRFYLRPENGKIVIRIDFGGSAYVSRLTFDALSIPGEYNPDPSALRGWSSVASNAVGSGEVEALRARTYHSRNILGPVSHSNGVPTGAIIERGSNANGEYVRFADGTQICTHTHNTAGVSIETAFQGGFRSTGIAWTFPAAFAASPAAHGAPTSVSHGFGVNVEAGSTVSTNFVFTAIASQGAADRAARLVAIGRWY